MSLTKTRAIVIHSTAYSENSVILSCYTEHYGLQSYLINGVRSNKGAIRPSHLLPLNLLELEVYHQQNKNLQRIRELKCSPVLHELHMNMIKSTIALFIAELMHRLIREENHTDGTLFTFLYHAVQILDVSDQHPANFPVMFMTHLSRYLGIFPKGQYSETNNGFDLSEGAFGTYFSGNPLMMPPDISSRFSLFVQSSFDDFAGVQLSYDQRKSLIDFMILYYREQLHNRLDMKSHQVLSSVLSG